MARHVKSSTETEAEAEAETAASAHRRRSLCDTFRWQPKPLTV